ncbi:MAG: hypothetical protein Q4A15_00445 [Prevotellaceae bacterium]|nr:hypothetical protein [Prevotellaceae bacterium]
MGKTNFELNPSAVRSEILQAGWMLNYVESEAQRQCGSDEHIKSFIGFDRAKAIIYPDRKED